MTLETLMATVTIDANFSGICTNDDNVLAVNIGEESAEVGTYLVAQLGISGIDPQLNPESDSKAYIRAGASETKTSNQRTFSISGDRFIGDPFQDYCFSHDIMYGTGQSVIVDYVLFNIITGKGEKGKVSIVVNSDGSGEAGETSEIDVELKQSMIKPIEYTYTPAA